MLFATMMAVIVGLYHDLVQVRSYEYPPAQNALALTRSALLSLPYDYSLQGSAGWFPHLADYEGVSTVFDITSFALALLLVFRTNACYGRCALPYKQLYVESHDFASLA